MSIILDTNVKQSQFKLLREKIETKKLLVGVVGLGYVGLPFLVEKAKVGLDVIGFDRNQERVNQILDKQSYIDDISDKELSSIFSLAKVDITTDASRLAEADVVVICVPTPLDKNYCPDLSFVEGVCHQLKRTLRLRRLISHLSQPLTQEPLKSS